MPDSCTIGSNAIIDRDVVLGERVRVQSFAYLVGVTVADDAFIGPHVCFTNDPKLGEPKPEGYKYPQGYIGEGAAIGANATILPGIRIGAYAKVAAGSIVTKDVPAHALVKGAPARFVRFEGI